MELKEYQKLAASTAQDAAYNHDYLVPMIVGELGELFGQRAKSVWHGWAPARLKGELTAELGDVCWGVAILLDMEGISEIKQPLHGTPTTLWGDEMDPWHQLLQRSVALYQFYTESATSMYIPGEASQIWLLLERYAETITGSPFNEVLQGNLNKLASRAARGVLQGSGDHR